MPVTDLIQHVPDVISHGKDILQGGIFAALGVFATAFYRWRTSKDRNQTKSDELFSNNLLGRTRDLEKDIDRLRHENETKDDLHDKEISLRRHEAQNAKMCFNYLIMLIKRIQNPPLALQSIINDIENMRSDLMKKEDQERLSVEEFEKAMRLIVR